MKQNLRAAKYLRELLPTEHFCRSYLLRDTGKTTSGIALAVRRQNFARIWIVQWVALVPPMPPDYPRREQSNAVLLAQTVFFHLLRCHSAKMLPIFEVSTTGADCIKRLARR